MWSIRALGVFVVASICAVIVVGNLHRAPADVLCKTASNPNPCGANTYPATTTFNAKLKTGTKVLITTDGGDITPTITCTTSTLGLRNINAGGAQHVSVSVVMTALTLTGCSGAPDTCSAAGTVGNLAGGLISWSNNTNDGDLYLVPPTISFTCGTKTCIFGGSGLHLTASITGANPATMNFTTWPLMATGNTSAGCPSSAALSALYQLTAVASSPTALFIEKTN
ncbi:MAG TPA: hypothetical protein VFY45_08865 [Baekduia sp.]|nr:hypothetical protein [Baekduia sp.]